MIGLMVSFLIGEITGMLMYYNLYNSYRKAEGKKKITFFP